MHITSNGGGGGSAEILARGNSRVSGGGHLCGETKCYWCEICQGFG